MSKGINEKDLIEKITQSQGIMHKISRTYCDTAEERQELVQEMVIQLWKSYDTFQSKSRFSTWMYRVCLNVALQKVRKERHIKSKAVDFVPEVIDRQEEDPYEDEAKWLRNAIGQLNKIEKAIILLYLEEKEYEEIAEIMGITQNYVRVKMNRIKKKLKKILNRETNGR
ncbi:MAG: sigma-70 family RNA polymerase sigma factor [Fulvivirga sp.]|nr:sigma-70 family RNA polymerase sigma factor [Fulvivirga sp.]